MADNVVANPGADGAVFATDDIGGVQFPRHKLVIGADGVNGGDVSASNPLPVTGTVATGGLTDAQLRASAVPVSGPLTDAQLRATAVPVSAAALPLPSGAATETTLATLNTKMPALGQAVMASSQPVVIASDQTAVPTVENATVYTGAAAQTAVVNNILESVSGGTATACENVRTGSVQVVSTGTAGTFIFEQSNNNVNFVPLPVFNAALVTGVPITAAVTASASQIIYTFPIHARFIRLRIATLITGGSIQAFSRFSANSWTASAQLVASNVAANMLSQVSGSVTSTLAAATVRAGFVAGAGIWYDDSSTNLAAAATFTGTSRDLTVTATATAFANAATYAQEVRVSAESDVTGTLWLEASRDNTNWRRVKSVATTAVTGGGFYAEIVHRPSWRYIRVGYTNGAGAQARFTIGSYLMAV